MNITPQDNIFANNFNILKDYICDILNGFVANFILKKNKADNMQNEILFYDQKIFNCEHTSDELKDIAIQSTLKVLVPDIIDIKIDNILSEDIKLIYSVLIYEAICIDKKPINFYIDNITNESYDLIINFLKGVNLVK